MKKNLCLSLAKLATIGVITSGTLFCDHVTTKTKNIHSTKYDSIKTEPVSTNFSDDLFFLSIESCIKQMQTENYSSFITFIEQNPMYLEYVEDQTDEICITALRKNILAVQHVRYMSYGIRKYLATNTNVNVGQPTYLIINDICKNAVLDPGTNLQHTNV